MIIHNQNNFPQLWIWNLISNQTSILTVTLSKAIFISIIQGSILKPKFFFFS